MASPSSLRLVLLLMGLSWMLRLRWILLLPMLSVSASAMVVGPTRIRKAPSCWKHVVIGPEVHVRACQAQRPAIDEGARTSIATTASDACTKASVTA